MRDDLPIQNVSSGFCHTLFVPLWSMHTERASSASEHLTTSPTLELVMRHMMTLQCFVHRLLPSTEASYRHYYTSEKLQANLMEFTASQEREGRIGFR